MTGAGKPGSELDAERTLTVAAATRVIGGQPIARGRLLMEDFLSRPAGAHAAALSCGAPPGSCWRARWQNPRTCWCWTTRLNDLDRRNRDVPRRCRDYASTVTDQP